ncbi:hypothetical protein [Embleya hyalina]|nr:hypothetical protein [Embleya hyalina]
MGMVDWRQLGTATRNADDIPAALESLIFARDGAEAQIAYWKIDNHVIRQGTLFDSSYEVVKLLCPRLGDRSLISRPWLYEIMAQFYFGFDVPGSAPPYLRAMGFTSLWQACVELMREMLPDIVEQDFRDTTQPFDLRHNALMLFVGLNPVDRVHEVLAEVLAIEKNEEMRAEISENLRVVP